LQLRLLDLDLKQPRERLLSQALSLCVDRIGSVRSPSPELLGRLTLSDRHALVQSLLLAQDRGVLAAVADCPGCAYRLEMTLDLRTIKVPRIPDSGRVILKRREKGQLLRRRLRLPCQVDLELANDEASLLGLCLGCTPDQARPWLSVAEKTLANCDPLGSMEIIGSCPECGKEVQTGLDLEGTWLSRLRSESGSLLEEIHVLALSYHWTEGEILRLPVGRRQEYLDLCWAAPAAPIFGIAQTG
jgi:hypothetical protein